MRRCGLVRITHATAGAFAIQRRSISNGKSAAVMTSGKASGVIAVLILFALTFLTSCQTQNSSSGSRPMVVSAANGSQQTALVSTAFAMPLVAVVTEAGVPQSGVTVTFTAPATGA